MLCSHDLCTGCAACAAACPVDAISMVRDEDGFYFPQISDACIHCGRCEKTCPILSPARPHDTVPPRTYVMKHPSRDVLLDSASGGMFSALAEWALQRDGCVYGAVWDDAFRVRLVRADTWEESVPMRDSKYVYSHAESAYPDVKEQLARGRIVVFTGLPCQIAGLYGYLGREYDNLLTAEIVCHGSGSELVFEEYIRALEKSEGKKVAALNQCSKTPPWNKLIRRVCAIQWEDGSTSIRDFTVDSYLSVYMKQLCYNNACFQCARASLPRLADITMADFMGVGVVRRHKLRLRDGVSAVWGSSEKGVAVLEELRDSGAILLEACGIEECLWFNHQFWKPSPRPAGRERFFRSLHERGYDQTVREYFTENRKYRLLNKIKTVIRRVLGSHLTAYGMYLNYRRLGYGPRIREQIDRLTQTDAQP